MKAAKLKERSKPLLYLEKTDDPDDAALDRQRFD